MSESIWAESRDPVTGRYQIVHSVWDRFWSKVLVGDGCWEWTAGSTPLGYGRFHVDGRLVGPHRMAYEMLVGPIPEGLQLDHLCCNPPCVNPEHLEAVSAGENARRSPYTLQGANIRKTHCPQGHPFDEANTYVHPDGWRDCRICRRVASRAWRERSKA